MAQLKTYIVRFSNRITPVEVDFFRGAVIGAAELRGSDLYHNHLHEGLRMKYPLIQYKILDGRAAVVGVGDGADELKALAPHLEKVMHIGYKDIDFHISRVEEATTNVEVSQQVEHYSLSGWMPLNQHNVRQFHACKDEGLRMRILEQVLTGNILSFFKGFGHFTTDRILCHIDHRGPILNEEYKKVMMKTMDIDFRCNVRLPYGIGLGKGCSLGHGTLTM